LSSAVDRKIEQRQFPGFFCQLQPDSDRPDFF